MNDPDNTPRGRLESRHVISLSISVLSVLVLVYAGQTGWRAWHDLQAAKDVAFVHDIADDFIEAASQRGLERTYGSALIGNAQLAPVLRESFFQARQQGDSAWQRAMNNARQLAARATADTELVARLRQTQAAYDALRDLRVRIDGCLGPGICPVANDTWRTAVSELVAQSAATREAAFLSLDSPRHLTQLHITLKRSAWVVSEYTRRQRGLVAFQLATAQAGTLVGSPELRDARAIAGHALEDLRTLGRLGNMDARISQAIVAVDRSLSTGFDPLLTNVLAGRLRVDASDWLSATNPASEALHHLNGSVRQLVLEQTKAAREENRTRSFVAVLLGILALAITALSMTKVRQIANALFHQKELAEVTIRSIGDAVITTDANARVEYLNPVAERMTGWRSSEAMGRPLAEVFSIVNGLTLEPQPSPMESCLRENRVVGLDNNTVLIRRDGGRHYIEDSAAPIRDRSGQLVGGVLVFYDTTEVHQAGHLIAYHATHDTLSGLINRREFEHRLAALLVREGSDGGDHALMYMDVDQFKVVNDTCGHVAGDQLLRELSKIVKAQVRNEDTLARLGGDEFGLLLENCSLDRAAQIAESVRESVATHRFEWQDTYFNPHVSIGLVPFGDEPTTPAALLGRADAACNVAKEKGRDRVQVYESDNLDMGRRLGEMHWVARINRALEECRFRLYCQPIVPIGGAGRRHGEVLVRMLDEAGKLVPPCDFIPPAERYGLMPKLDRWIVQEALSLFAKAHADGRGEQAGMLAINLSGMTLGDGLIEHFLREEIARSGLPPSTLCFEVTETAAIANLGECSVLIESLRALGCRFALDDFGSGMSSFSYLKQLPVDYLKIDGGFVRHMVSDPVSAAMVEAIHAVGRAMKIRTIAEFVENEAILHRLTDVGVDYAQGYGVGQPVPLHEYLGLGG